MPRKKSPAAPPPVNLLHHPAAAKRSAELTQLVDQLAHPDLAWRYRNDRPAEPSVGLKRLYIPNYLTTLFHPPEDVRGFYLPASSWELFIEILLSRFRFWCSFKRDDENFWWSTSVENLSVILAEIAWAIELIENRLPVTDSEAPAQELRMHWGWWFDLFLHELDVAAEFCPPDRLQQYTSAALTLRTQCSPRNPSHLTGGEAKARILAAVDEQRSEKSYRERFGV